MRPKGESASAAAISEADVNLASAPKASLVNHDCLSSGIILMVQNYSCTLGLPPIDVLLLSLPLVRFPAIDDVTKELSKQMGFPLRVVIKVILKCRIYLHWIVIVYAGIANINTCQTEQLFNFVCFHSVVPQHLPAHPSERSMRIRHQPAAEFFPTWLDRPWVTCKNKLVRIIWQIYRIENCWAYQDRARLLQRHPRNRRLSTIACN